LEVHEQQFGDNELPATQVSVENERARRKDRWRDDGGFDNE